MRARLLATTLVAAALVVATALPASAHSYLVSSTPEQDAVLTELPAQFSVTANEPLLDVTGDATGFGMFVMDASGRYFGDGCVTLDRATMSTDAALGAAGTYSLVWQLVSADGHRVSDEIAFEWQPPADFEAVDGSTSAPTCGGEAEPAPDEAPEAAVSSDALWLGGAGLAALLAVAITVLIARRRKP